MWLICGFKNLWPPSQTCNCMFFPWVYLSLRGTTKVRTYKTIAYVRCESESEVAQSCLTLCDPMDCSLSVSSIHGIFQARVLEWVAISFSRGSSRPRNQTRLPRIAGRRFTVWATREAGTKGICCLFFTLEQFYFSLSLSLSFFFWLCFKSSNLLNLQIQLSVTLTNFISTYYMPRTVLSTGCKMMNVYKNVCVFICREIHMCIYMLTCMNAHTHIS